MMHRYLLIEPLYSDPDTFCNFTVGSGRVRASIQIYADVDMLAEAARALTAPDLSTQYPAPHEEPDFDSFRLYVSVLPGEGGQRTVRFVVCHGMCDDEAPFMADIRFEVPLAEAREFGQELSEWLEKRNFPLEWKP